jgi:hypothetical protein
MSVTWSLLADWNCLQVQAERSISFAFAGALHAKTPAKTPATTTALTAAGMAAPSIVAAVLIARP